MGGPKRPSEYRVEGDVALVELGAERGVFIVDLIDLALVVEHRWQVGSKGYVIRTDRSVTPRRTLRVHRVIMGLEPGDPRQVDHENGNPLDNRRANLRICPAAIQAQNRKVHRTSASGIRGVGYRKEHQHRLKPWTAHLRIDGKQRVLGYYATKDEAAAAVSAARKVLMPFSVDR